jgi:hypothetical protein
LTINLDWGTLVVEDSNLSCHENESTDQLADGAWATSADDQFFDSLDATGEEELEEGKLDPQYFEVSLSDGLELDIGVQAQPPLAAAMPSASVHFSAPTKSLHSHSGLEGSVQSVSINSDQAQSGGLAADAQSPEAPPLEDVSLAKIKTFCSCVLRTLAPPLLKEIESAKQLRPETEPFTPRRVTRSGIKSGPGKPFKRASAAEAVLLKALGIAPQDLAVDEKALHELKVLFDSPLKEQHLRAIASIFGKVVLPVLEGLSPVRGEVSVN